MTSETNIRDKVVLIAEDSRALCRELERRIRREVGLDVRVCTTRAEAEGLLCERCDDVFAAIVGLRLLDAPDGEVVDVCCCRSVPCIVFTADMEEATRRDMFTRNILDYVVKDANAVSNIVDYLKRLTLTYGERILIIDDSAAVSAVLVDMLGRQMYRVESVSDAETGLRLLEGNRQYALVVVDYCLPGMDGLEATSAIRAMHAKEHLGIIGISVSDDPTLSVRFIKSGANDFIAKPFQMEEFFSRVANNVETVVNQRNLSEAKAVMNRFLGMASHDLRSPINSVKGFTEMLLDGAYGDVTDNQAEALDFIRAANNHMRNLVVDLLDMSVFEAGELQLVKESADLCDLIDLRIRIHTLDARKKNIAVRANCADIGHFFFDTRRISQVIDNLLTNGVKFTPQGGTVTISLDKADGMARVCVRDTGQGVPPGEEELLFQSFKKTSVRPTGGESSTGLGLPIVKTIVEEHGGQVWVESRYGEGAAFYFTLPLVGSA